MSIVCYVLVLWLGGSFAFFVWLCVPAKKANVPPNALAISGTNYILQSMSLRFHYFALANKIRLWNGCVGNGFKTALNFCKISVTSC
jgi:hypothetical protein